MFGICFVGLSGEFQKLNAALAIALSHTWITNKIENRTDNDVFQRFQNAQNQIAHYPLFPLNEMYLKGLSNAYWPGRAQIIRLKVFWKQKKKIR